MERASAWALALALRVVVVTPWWYMPVVRADSDGRGAESDETKVMVERWSLGDRVYNVGDGKDGKEGERRL